MREGAPLQKDLKTVWQNRSLRCKLSKCLDLIARVLSSLSCTADHLHVRIIGCSVCLCVCLMHHTCQGWGWGGGGSC